MNRKEKRPKGRPIKIEWQERAEELEKRYRKEKNVRIRQRLHALWLLRQGESMKTVSNVLGSGYRSVQRWAATYRSGGLEAVLIEREGATPGQKSYLTDVKQRALIAKANLGEWQRAEEAVKWVKDRWGVEYTVAGMQTLFRRLTLTKKVPRRQAAQADIQEQESWEKGG